jgi:hypothetical protein
LGTRVIWTFREIFNDNLTLMALKGKNCIPMTYKG